MKKLSNFFIFMIIAAALAYGLMPHATESSSSGHDVVTTPEQSDLATKDTTSEFPKEISGMQLISLQTGDDAKQGIDRLHGLSIELKNAYFATYQGDKGSAMIWVSESNNEQEAKELFKIMDEKMPKNPSFTDYHPVNVNGQQYRYVFWPKRNMHNYYFVLGTKNYWVAVDTENPMPFLSEVLRKL